MSELQHREPYRKSLKTVELETLLRVGVESLSVKQIPALIEAAIKVLQIHEPYVRNGRPGYECAGCFADWPCPTVKLIGTAVEVLR